MTRIYRTTLSEIKKLLGEKKSEQKTSNFNGVIKNIVEEIEDILDTELKLEYGYPTEKIYNIKSLSNDISEQLNITKKNMTIIKNVLKNNGFIFDARIGWILPKSDIVAIVDRNPGFDTCFLTIGLRKTRWTTSVDDEIKETAKYKIQNLKHYIKSKAQFIPNNEPIIRLLDQIVGMIDPSA